MPLLLAYGINRFSHDVAHIYICNWFYPDIFRAFAAWWVEAIRGLKLVIA